MDIQKAGFLSIEQLTDRYLTTKKADAGNTNTFPSFEQVLNRKQIEQRTEGGLKFSKHAVNRLADRGIELNENQLERLTGGARRAGQKGIEESLVLVDDLAFIVNVPNNTVVTAMDSTRTDENIFTNINGAVIA